MITDPITGHFLPTKKFEIVCDAIVDDELWYTVRVNTKDAEKWLRAQDKNLVCSLSSAPFFSLFDVHEKLYTAFALRWS